VAVLLAGLALAGEQLAQAVARGLLAGREQRQGDRWALLHEHWGAVIRRHRPILVLERDRHGEDASVPVDFRACRERACAALGRGRPTAFVHVLRREPEAFYLQYWLYYPDSQTSHLPLPALRGAHRDDWEGVIVRIDKQTGAVSARASAHGAFAGAGPWWSATPGWRPVAGRPVIHRAAGSHAGGFEPDDLDLAGDAWNGTLATLDDVLLLPADEAPAARRRFDPAAPPPWHKAVWTEPEAASTGTVAGARDELTRAADAWARAHGWLPAGLRPALATARAPRRRGGRQARTACGRRRHTHAVRPS
jgi:hypothetical protein